MLAEAGDTLNDSSPSWPAPATCPVDCRPLQVRRFDCASDCRLRLARALATSPPRITIGDRDDRSPASRAELRRVGDRRQAISGKGKYDPTAKRAEERIGRWIAAFFSHRIVQCDLPEFRRPRLNAYIGMIVRRPRWVVLMLMAPDLTRLIQAKPTTVLAELAESPLAAGGLLGRLLRAGGEASVFVERFLMVILFGPLT